MNVKAGGRCFVAADAAAAGDRLGLDRRWSGAIANGARLYSVDAYTAAFAMIVAWSILSCLLIAITRETGCRQTA